MAFIRPGTLLDAIKGYRPTAALARENGFQPAICGSTAIIALFRLEFGIPVAAGCISSCGLGLPAREAARRSYPVGWNAARTEGRFGPPYPEN
jgi:hypothetical protein